MPLWWSKSYLRREKKGRREKKDPRKLYCVAAKNHQYLNTINSANFKLTKKNFICSIQKNILNHFKK